VHLVACGALQAKEAVGSCILITLLTVRQFSTDERNESFATRQKLISDDYVSFFKTLIRRIISETIGVSGDCGK
jgi:hypothetical protein